MKEYYIYLFFTWAFALAGMVTRDFWLFAIALLLFMNYLLFKKWEQPK